MNRIMDIKDREKIVNEIAKTSKSIRKKYRALKTGRLNEDVTLERHFKPIVEPLKQIVERTANVEGNVDVKTEASSMSTNVNAKKVILKPGKKNAKRKVKKWKSNMSWDYSDMSTLSSPKQKQLYNPPLVSTSMEASEYEQSHESLPINTLPVDENTVFETPVSPFATSVKHRLQMLEGQQKLRNYLGPLGQIYMGAVLSGKKDTIDSVYGVRFNNDGITLGDKDIDVDRNDNIIIDGITYKGTPGLYELIFKRIPDDAVYTESDMQKYKSILFATNAHRRGYNSQNPISGNRGYKYKYIIAPLVSHVSSNKVVGKGLPQETTMLLNDNKIDYIYWNDPNELVDRLQLLEASRQAGNNAHNNEISSIIEELREAGLII